MMQQEQITFVLTYVSLLLINLFESSATSFTSPTNSYAKCSFLHSASRNRERKPQTLCRVSPPGNSGNSFYDEDEFWEEDDEDSREFARLTREKQAPQFVDKSGAFRRQFRLGFDVTINDFVGSLGFDEVTDWEYYMEDFDEEEQRSLGTNRKVVQPPPFDPSKPKRTREKSEGVVRVFIGEFVGRLGAVLRSQGMDNRVLIKEYSGDLAMELAMTEKKNVASLQSRLCQELDEGANAGDWSVSASVRFITGRTNGDTKEDDKNLIKLLEIISGNVQPSNSYLDRRTKSTKSTPYVGILGELIWLPFFEDDNAKNTWYRTLKQPPPKPGSYWMISEYAGLSTLANYAQPALKRLFNLPIKKGFFGNPLAPPALPSYEERAKYVIQGILKGSLEALAILHENNIVHRSIGQNSIILSSVGQDKREASSPLATVRQRLVVKLADLGFSCTKEDLSKDEAFRNRARSYNVHIEEGSSSITVENFAVAEDLHALGFVFIAVILSSLSEIPIPEYTLPKTDEDSLQRLIVDIFGKDMDEFRDYCKAEEVWQKAVDLLDRNDKEGWKILAKMCFARENATKNLENGKIVTARSLLESSFWTEL